MKRYSLAKAAQMDSGQQTLTNEKQMRRGSEGCAGSVMQTIEQWCQRLSVAVGQGVEGGGVRLPPLSV